MRNAGPCRTGGLHGYRGGLNVPGVSIGMTSLRRSVSSLNHSGPSNAFVNTVPRRSMIRTLFPGGRYSPENTPREQRLQTKETVCRISGNRQGCRTPDMRALLIHPLRICNHPGIRLRLSGFDGCGRKKQSDLTAGDPSTASASSGQIPVFSNSRRNTVPSPVQHRMKHCSTIILARRQFIPTVREVNH
jgi:hypothetical protein